MGRRRVLGLCFGLDGGTPSPLDIAQSIRSRQFKSGLRWVEVKSLIKWGWWLQSIHKYRFMRLDSGWVVKVAVMPVRLGGGFCLCFYIRRLGGSGSPTSSRSGG